MTVAACVVLVTVLGWLVRHDGALPRWDARVVADVASRRGDATVDLARAITLLGDFRVLAILAVALVAATVVARRRATDLSADHVPGHVRDAPPSGPRRWSTATAALPGIALLTAGALNPLLKAIVDRPRPPEVLHRVTESSSGFPSGHSAHSAAAWLCLGLLLWATGRSRIAVAACVAATVLVGASRVVLAVHSPTDVVAGWAVGLAVAVVVLAVASARSGRRPT